MTRSKVIELVINNLSPTAHVLHLHGGYFEVINYADFKWCYFNQTAVNPSEPAPSPGVLHLGQQVNNWASRVSIGMLRA